jgi:type II secretory pathway pseudopilin PulG
VSRLRDERGFTLVEAAVVCAILGVVLTGLVNVLVSGRRAEANATGRIEAQQNVRLALDRLAYEGRCASSAAIVSGGAGVQLTLPAVCSHASGTVTWCVVAGTLTRFASAGCAGTGRPYVRSLTSATPFSLPAPPAGTRQQLQVDLTANATGFGSDGFSLDQAITLRNV